jgi:subtilase family serine protease
MDKVAASDPAELISVGAASVGYPASSPVVTGVGGTGMVLDKSNRIVFQYPWNETDYGAPGTELAGGEVRFTAGGGTGGTSLLYAAPGYQLDAGIRSARRKVPDVAMYADEAPGVPVYCTAYDAATGQGPCAPNPATGTPFRAIGGTSFAAPLLAGGVLIANQYARAKGGPPIGFANPLLYDLGGDRSPALRDVLQGDNDILGIGCCGAGPGYDTASGWGSVNVTRFAQAAHRAWDARPRASSRSAGPPAPPAPRETDRGPGR